MTSCLLIALSLLAADPAAAEKSEAPEYVIRMDVLEGDPLGSYRIISRPQVCVLENDSFTVSLPAAGRTGRKIDLSAKVGSDGNGKLRLDATVITYTEPSADEKHPPGVRVLNEVESTQLSGTFQKGQAIRFRLDQTEAGATRWAELRVMRIAGEAIAPEAVPAAGADAALRLKASRVHLPQDRINSSALSKTAAALAGESSPQPAAAPGTTDAVPVLDKDPVTRVFRNVGVAPSGARIGVPAPRPIATVAHAAVAPPEPKPGTRIYQVELAVFEGDHLGSEEEGTLRCLNRPTIAVVEGHSLSFICNPVDVTTELFGSVRSAPEGKAFVDLALRRSIHDSSPAGRSGSATERRVTRTEERVIQNEQRPLEHVDSCRLEGAFLLGRTIKLPLSKTDKGEPRWAEFRVTEVDPVGANAPPRTSEIKVGDIINVIVEDAGPDNTALSENIADLMIETTQPKPAPQARAQGVVPILGELPVTSPLFKKPRDSAPVRIGREPEDATAARIPILEKIPYIAGLFPNTASRVAMVGTVGTVDRRSSADSAGVPQPIVLHKDPATGLFRNVGVAPPAGRGEVAPAAFADASAKHVDEPLITATYAIHDLPLWHHHDGQSEHPACEALIRLIKGTIDPESWERGASIREFETTLSLVVRQTQANHDRIAKLIGLLRPERRITIVPVSSTERSLDGKERLGVEFRVEPAHASNTVTPPTGQAAPRPAAAHESKYVADVGFSKTRPEGSPFVNVTTQVLGTRGTTLTTTLAREDDIVLKLELQSIVDHPLGRYDARFFLIQVQPDGAERVLSSPALTVLEGHSTSIGIGSTTKIRLHVAEIPVGGP